MWMKSWVIYTTTPTSKTKSPVQCWPQFMPGTRISTKEVKSAKTKCERSSKITFHGQRTIDRKSKRLRGHHLQKRRKKFTMKIWRKNTKLSYKCCQTGKSKMSSQTLNPSRLVKTHFKYIKIMDGNQLTCEIRVKRRKMKTKKIEMSARNVFKICSSVRKRRNGTSKNRGSAGQKMKPRGKMKLNFQNRGKFQNWENRTRMAAQIQPFLISEVWKTWRSHQLIRPWIQHRIYSWKRSWKNRR